MKLQIWDTAVRLSVLSICSLSPRYPLAILSLSSRYPLSLSPLAILSLFLSPRFSFLSFIFLGTRKVYFKMTLVSIT